MGNSWTFCPTIWSLIRAEEKAEALAPPWEKLTLHYQMLCVGGRWGVLSSPQLEVLIKVLPLA
jgi:hypothetical protein